VGVVIGVVVSLASLAGGIWAVVRLVGWMRERTSSPALPTYSREELRKRLTILAIDDSGFTYMQDFKNDGYNIAHWTMVRSYTDVENYEHDVLVLDIRGIAPHLSAQDGLGVAINARKAMESLPIIIYSAATYNLTVDTSSADHVFEVSGGDYRRFRDLVDNAFDRLTSPDYYIRNFVASESSSVTDEDRLTVLEELRSVLIDPRQIRAARTYSSHESAARAAEILRHATAVSQRLQRADI
jgi:hypothetical protein